MRPMQRMSSRVALIVFVAVVAIATLLISSWSVSVADAQQGTPYPPPAATTAVPAPATATTAPAPPTATRAAYPPPITQTPQVQPPRLTPTPRPGLPQASGGSLPIVLGVVALTLAGAIALARRRLS